MERLLIGSFDFIAIRTYFIATRTYFITIRTYFKTPDLQTSYSIKKH